MKSISNNRGAMLVQVLVAFGLAMGLALVIANLMNEMQKTQKLSEVKNEELALMSRISNYLNDENICSHAFAALRPGDPFTLLEFSPNAGRTVLEVGEEFGNTGLIIQQLEILPDVTHLTGSNWEVTFRLTTQKKEGNYYMAGSTKQRDFTFMASLCEPDFEVFTSNMRYNELVTECNGAGSAPGVEHFWYSVNPESPSPIAGGFTCYLCASNKIILNCN